MTIIDPLEAAIAYLKTDTPLALLVSGRIATKHKFGAGWVLPSKALQLRYDGGTPDLYIGWQTPRLEVRCYGETVHDATMVYRRLVEISRATSRATIQITDGKALVYRLLMASGPSTFRDPDVDVDMVMVFVDCAVAEQAVP